MKFLGFLVATILLAVSRDGRTADNDGQYVTYLERTCWDYLVFVDTRNMVEFEKYGAWVGGYVTAYNRQTPDTISILGDADLNVAMGWLTQWCRANPKAKMGAAMNALTVEFHPRRHRTVNGSTK